MQHKINPHVGKTRDILQIYNHSVTIEIMALNKHSRQHVDTTRASFTFLKIVRVRETDWCISFVS